MKYCSKEGCPNKHWAKGLCKTHINNKWLKENPEISVRAAMISRCYKTTHQSYKNYGARGITVCDRWRFGEDGKSAYQCFIEDMGKRPSEHHSLDRINNDGNYEPSNCRWTTSQVQIINKRPSSKNPYGFTGVLLDKRTNKWFATIRVNYKRHHLGYFITQREAINARQKAEDKYYKPLLEDKL